MARKDSPQTMAETTVYQYANNLTLIHRRHTSNDIVAVMCVARPGAAFDVPEKQGRTHLMMRTLSKGTATMSSDEIAQTLEGMGSRLGTSGGHDYVSVSLQCVNQDLTDAMQILGDVIRHPSFPPEEIDTEKKRIFAEIRMREDRTPSAAMKKFRQELFGSSRYGRALEGDFETIGNLTQIDLVESHRLIFRPEHMVIVVVGNVTFDEARDLMAQRFGSMEPTNEPQSAATRAHIANSSLSQILRDVEQSFVTTGVVTCSIDHEDAPSVDVAAAILGRGMSSRLFRELREKKGLAYNVGAFNISYQDAGFLAAYIGTSHGTVCESMKGLWDEMKRMREEPVTEEELDRAKSYLIGGYLRDHEANRQQASHLAYWYITGLGVQYDDLYPERVRAVSSRDIMRIANKYFNDPTTVVVRPDDMDPECLSFTGSTSEIERTPNP